MNSYLDCYTLANGMKIPCLGFGTYNAKGGDNLAIIKNAIKAGFRYFDTASLYGTERVLGQAIKESGLAREEFFIVTKVWIDEMGYENTKEALKRSLERLQLDYVDLYLIHWPKAPEWKDMDWKKLEADTWRAMEEMCTEGKVRGIGLSNFLPHHLDNILSVANIKPVVDQLEVHPGYSQEKAVAYCQENNVLVQAWSPIGRSKMLENPLLLEYAAKYNKSVAQICLRFLVQKGIIPLVKTSTYERMKENQDIFEFEITKEDMQVLECMPQDTWLGEHPDFAIPKAKSNLEQ